MELIDKGAVIAEINRVLASYDPNAITSGRYALVRLRDFLDTLEVKEVELEKESDFNAEVSKFINTFYKNAKIGHKLMIRRTAKYFYDLGLKAKGE